MKLIAINKKYQEKVNRALYWLQQYDVLNDIRNYAEDNDQGFKIKQYNKKCENAFNKYLEIVDELPNREKQQIEKSIHY